MGKQTALVAALFAGAMTLTYATHAMARTSAPSATPTLPATVPVFYTASAPELQGAPGTLIRKQVMRGGEQFGAMTYRLLYRSTGMQGEPVAVSAILIVSRKHHTGERPLVAWNHPTSGVATGCAPSLSPGVLHMIPGLRKLMQLGYAVVATDYPGLATAGQHPYLVGDSEGRAALDAVRAAHEVKEAHVGKRFVLWGHSQGGHATLHAARLAASYAPELQLLGAAAAAPATDLVALNRENTSSPSSNVIGAMLMQAWSALFDLPLDKVVEPADVPAVRQLAATCITPPFDGKQQPVDAATPNVSYRPLADITVTSPWQSLLEKNSAGTLPKNVPVFLAQGSEDKLIPPAVTASYKQHLCQTGSTVRMVVMPGVEHRFIGREAAGAAVQWMQDRFDGKAPPNDCE